MNIEVIREYLSYDSETGVLTYRKSGKQCCAKDKDGYILVNVKNKRIGAHRCAWMLHYGELPQHQIDHINGIKDDNRIDNLREATPQQQAANKASLGIGRKCGKWRAHTKYNGKYIHIGLYDCPLMARIAYTDKMRELHGEYARY